MPTISNPFPGLRPFDASLHHLFFGREKQVEWLLELLQQQHFLVVVGPSGSGKSSLVRAGVVPTLEGGRDGQTWEVILTRPGRQILDNVAASLREAGAEGARERVLRGSSGLVDALAEAGFGAGRNALLIVDQFEELFRLQDGDEEQAAEAAQCIGALLYAVQQREVPVYVVLTMRAEFLGHCTLYPGLAEAINEADYLVPRMTQEQLRAAIEQPVAAAESQISSELVERLLVDVGGDENQLPILQHAMRRTWEHWQEHRTRADMPLDIDHYEAVGTVDDALSKHAEEMYMALPDSQAQRAAESIFKTLAGGTTLNGGRHPTSLAELVEIAGEEESTVMRAAEQFRQSGCWFLTPSTDVPLIANTILDIAHESLVRLWRRAQEWNEEEQASSVLYLRLASTAALYQEGRAGLYQDPDLELALEWRARSRPTAAWGRRYDPSFERAMTFLEHSRKERDFQVVRREEEQRRKLQRTRRFAVLMGGVSMVFLLLMVFALNLYFDAEESRKTADVERQNAEKQQQLAVEQREVAEGERRNAEKQQRIAVEQREVAEGERRNAEKQQQLAVEQREVAEGERRNAEKQQRIAVEQREAAEGERRNAEKQQRIAVEQREAAEKARLNAERLRLLSVARSLAIQATKIQARDDQGQLAALLALQAFRFNERYGGSSSDPDIYNALQAAYTTFDEGQSGVLRGHADGVRAVAFAPGGGELASAGDDGAVRLWSLRESTQGRVLMRGGRAGVRSLAFDASGHLAVGTTAGAVWFLDLTGNAEPQKMASDSPLATISALSYAKDGRLVAVDGKGGARVYPAAENWGQALVSGDASGPLYASAVGGSHLAIGGDGGRIWIWETENWQREPQLLEAGGSTIRRLAFSADGSRLAAGTYSGDLLVWEGSDWAVAPQQLLGHSSSITGLSFHGDGHLLASSSLDRTVRIWNVKEGGSITIAQDDWVWDVAFSPDGRRIASAGADRTVRIWHAHVEELAAVVETHITREMTTVEWQDFVGEDIPYEQTRLRLSGAAP
jgi:WD40 repeat protein/energy-coupling factor transporter ATP-binding protein EcfA2